jgi:CheY-like chemotaxis protein
MFLELAGHEVQLSADGADGVEKSRQFRPEVVLCDIGLPGLSGYEVARLLRSDPTTSSLYLVALSGYALPEDVAKARAAGFDLHLAKPFSPEKLQETLAALDSRS